ncbi:DUF2332 domain-containing protein [Arthrobacter sp. LAPM80]|uniref:DUF2332 domain-containing protein n=1 Tax=Arthrobacter sp. LAPM80 TaxID=3141788 RepID=UPI00398B66FB
MPRKNAEQDATAGSAHTLAAAYRRFGVEAVAKSSPLYGRVADALAGSTDVLAAIGAMPARRRNPVAILAALHDLALSGQAPALASAYAVSDGDAAVVAAIDTLLRMTDSVIAVALRRPVRSDETGRHAVLYPAIAEGAHRIGAESVGLVDLGCGAGFNLNVDRVGITFSNGQVLGDLSSPLRQAASIVGNRPVPTTEIPHVVVCIGIDATPIDVTDTDDARWLSACLWPDKLVQAERLEARTALAATATPLLRQGDPVELLPDAIARVSGHALPVITTTWALSSLSPGRRLNFLERLGDAAATPRRTVPSCASPSRVSGSPRKFPRLATAPPLATALSASQGSTAPGSTAAEYCAPRPLAAAGRAAACCRGARDTCQSTATMTSDALTTS